MKFIYLALLTGSAVILSSCSIPPTADNTANNQPTPTIITTTSADVTVTASPSPSDDQLMQDLSSDPNFNIDSTLNSLNSDLK